MKNRQPPHNLEAERYVLGCMLVTRPAIENAVEIIRPDDFYLEAHRWIFEAITAQWIDGKPTEPPAVAMRLGSQSNVKELRQLQGEAPLSTNVRHYAQLVAELAVLRRITTVAGEIGELPFGDTDGTTAVARARELIEQIDLPALSHVGDPDLGQFLAESDEYEWVIRDLLETYERALVVAPEGFGKSVLLRQVAVQCSQGVHPFQLQPIDPLRVLLIDFENPPRLVRRKLRALAETAAYGVGETYDERRLRIIAKPEGIDITNRGDMRWLLERVRANRPDLICVGPIYKMHEAEDEKQADVRQIQKALDLCRVRFKCALLMETHAPHESFKKGGQLRPSGSRLWMRWPEYVLTMVPDSNNPENCHLEVLKARDERSWPVMLRRGGRWPWMADTF